MILAVPMVVITRIVCDHLEHPYAKTLMRLLEGNIFEVRLVLVLVRCLPRNRAHARGGSYTVIYVRFLPFNMTKYFVLAMLPCRPAFSCRFPTPTFLS